MVKIDKGNLMIDTSKGLVTIRMNKTAIAAIVKHFKSNPSGGYSLKLTK